MIEIGRLFVIIGVILVIFGFLLTISDRLPFQLGKLPGDIIIKKESFNFYFPITTSIVISVVLSLIFYLFGKFIR